MESSIALLQESSIALLQELSIALLILGEWGRAFHSSSFLECGVEITVECYHLSLEDSDSNLRGLLSFMVTYEICDWHGMQLLELERLIFHDGIVKFGIV